MKNRIVPFMLAMAFLCSLCGGIAAAAETRSSDILLSYQVTLSAGTNTGEVKINYDVKAEKNGTVGVESIEIRQSNGAYVTTITGTTSNGLLASDAVRNSGTYVYQGTSGTYYYAIVTVSAKAGSLYDSRDIKTGIAKAP